MSETLKIQFQKAVEAFQSMELAKKQLERVQQRVRQSFQQLQDLDRVVEKEYKEYEALEKAGLRKVFKKILGQGDEQLEKEKQDYLEAVLNYNQKKKEIELLQFEEKVLIDKLRAEKTIKEEFDRNFQAYSQYLIVNNTATGKQLVEIEEQINSKLKDLKELQGAQRSGAEVTEKMQRIIGLLNKAGWWGSPDWRGNNPLKVAADKIGSIDQAVKLIPEANHQLQLFIDELKDIYIDKNSKLDYNQTAFSRFSGGFYDSLIIDWILRGKAQNALNVVISTRDKLTVTLRSLEMRVKNLNASIQLLEKRKKELVINKIG